MSDLENSYVMLFGKHTNDASRERLLRIKESLGIKDNDALWSVLLALESYQDLYEQIPEQIAARAKVLLVEFQKAAKAASEASQSHAQRELAEAVSKASMQVAQEVAKQHRADASRKLVERIIVAVIVVVLCAAGLTAFVYNMAHDAGVTEGHALGYERARVEKASAAWANTAEGRLAAELAKSGALPMIARCSAPGWQIKDGVCYPFPDERGRSHGWRMPSSQR